MPSGTRVKPISRHPGGGVISSATRHLLGPVRGRSPGRAAPLGRERREQPGLCSPRALQPLTNPSQKPVSEEPGDPNLQGSAPDTWAGIKVRRD